MTMTSADKQQQQQQQQRAVAIDMAEMAKDFEQALTTGNNYDLNVGNLLTACM